VAHLTEFSVTKMSAFPTRSHRISSNWTSCWSAFSNSRLTSSTRDRQMGRRTITRQVLRRRISFADDLTLLLHNVGFCLPT
jgi:hypothetical protein